MVLRRKKVCRQQKKGDKILTEGLHNMTSFSSAPYATWGGGVREDGLMLASDEPWNPGRLA